MTSWLRFASVMTLALLVGATTAQAEETGAAPAATDSPTAAAPEVNAAAPEQPSPPSPEPAPATPAAAPTAPPAPAQPSPGAASTRPFIIVCQDGECVPYTRGCPRGLRFDGVHDCVLPGAPPPEDKAAAALEEAQKLATRMRNRMRPRLTISLEGMGGFLGRSPSATALSLRLLLGYRGQITPRAGVALRGGLVGGTVFHDESSGTTPADSDSTTAGGVVAEIAPYLGPFGRVYFGPMVFLGYFAYGKNTLNAGTELLSLRSGGTVGLGLHGGVLLGDQERVAIQFSVQGSGLNGLFLFTAVGAGLLF